MSKTFEEALSEITAAGAIMKGFWQADSRKWSVHVEYRLPGKVGRGHVEGGDHLPTAMLEALSRAESDSVKLAEHWKTLESSGPRRLPIVTTPGKALPPGGLSLASLGLGPKS